MDTRKHLPMLGDIVRPLPHRDPLTSGCSRYDDAVVVRVDPFALVSRQTDMLWEITVERHDFEAVDVAKPTLLDACMQRVTYGLTNRQVKRARRKHRRRLRLRAVSQ